MRNILILVILTAGFVPVIKAQTYVSGGVFSNTVWTQANSPYIVTDTTVVFPGVTLTIEPGVTMKFDDHAYLEIRQGTLIATGTAADSITFTSNSLTPVPGIWGGWGGGIYLNTSNATSFNYCNVSYAGKSITAPSYVIQYIKNSTFKYNLYGMYSITNFPVDSCVFDFNSIGIGNLSNTTMNYCSISNNDYGVETSNNVTISNCAFDFNNLALGGMTVQVRNSRFNYCSISHNQIGLKTNEPGNSLQHCIIHNNIDRGIVMAGGVDSIFDCEIMFNGIGVVVNSGVVISHCDIEYDTIGILLGNSFANIHCNKICNNISYGLQMNNIYNVNVGNNYWCTNDSAQIAAAIYDGYDNVVNGLVTFIPADTVQCYTLTGISEFETQKESFRIFPNPASDYIIIKSLENISITELRIFSMIGELEAAYKITKPEINLNISGLPSGIHFLEITCNESVTREKLIKQ